MEPVRVFARPRPRVEEDAYPECIEPQENRDELWIRPQTKDHTKHCPAGDQNFVFDGVLSEEGTTQNTVYSSCAEKVISTVLSGYNGTVMCYGQTGAGKTYTMSGKVSNVSNLEAFHAMSEGPDRGIMQRAIDHIFKSKAQVQASSAARQRGGENAGGGARQGDASNSEIRLKMSYIEIYNDVVHDLIQEYSHSIALRKSMVNEASVVSPLDRHFPGVSRHELSTRDQAMELLHAGLKRRQVAAHNLNRDSSRSHAILTIYVTRGGQKKDRKANGAARAEASAGKNEGEAVHSRLDLVDLAGSERLSKTQSSGVHQSEAQHINKSLSFLEQVVLAIGDPNRDHIPYRTCKLTQFLKESIGGNSYTVFIANVRLESPFLSETIRTCRFAQRMLNVKNSPILNVIRNDKNISQYIKKLVDENNHLKEELALYDALTQTRKEYDPYTDEQRANLAAQVVKYFENESWSVNNFSPLEFSSVRHIKEIILQCKAIYRRAEVPSSELRVVANDHPFLAGNGESGANGDWTPREARNGNRTSCSPEDQPINSSHHSQGTGSPVRRENSNGSHLPRSQSSSSSGPALDQAKLEDYKKGQGRQLQEALDENRMLVKTKKKEANMIAKQMNDIIKQIKSAAAEEDKPRVTALKGDYRELHQERAMLLSEIDHCKNLAAECSKKLVQGVNECLQ